MNEPPFGTLITALVTIFDEAGAVDHAATLKVAKHCLKTGSDALVIAGTTGESPTLKFEEEEALFRYLRKALPGATLIAGTGSNDTSAAVEHSVLARKIGMDGLLLVNPYYNRPQQEGLFEHFQAIVKEAKLPTLLYNIPGRTAGEIETDTLLRLAKNKYIVGVKECAGKYDRLLTLAKEAPKFAVYGGDDGVILPMMAAGAVGLVGVGSHLVGAKMKKAMTLFQGGKSAEARATFLSLLDFFSAIYSEVNPVGIKTALGMAGIANDTLRPPLHAASPATRTKIKAALLAQGLIKKA